MTNLLRAILQRGCLLLLDAKVQQRGEFALALLVHWLLPEFGLFSRELRRLVVCAHVHGPVLGLLPSHAHVVLEVDLAWNEVELADEFDEVVAAEALAVLLIALVFVDLENHHLVASQLAPTILAEDVKLHELKPVVTELSSED